MDRCTDCAECKECKPCEKTCGRNDGVCAICESTNCEDCIQCADCPKCKKECVTPQPPYDDPEECVKCAKEGCDCEKCKGCPNCAKECEDDNLPKLCKKCDETKCSPIETCSKCPECRKDDPKDCDNCRDYKEGCEHKKCNYRKCSLCTDTQPVGCDDCLLTTPACKDDGCAACRQCKPTPFRCSQCKILGCDSDFRCQNCKNCKEPTPDPVDPDPQLCASCVLGKCNTSEKCKTCKECDFDFDECEKCDLTKCLSEELCQKCNECNDTTCLECEQENCSDCHKCKICPKCQDTCKVDCNECDANKCSNCDVCKECKVCAEKCKDTDDGECKNCDDILKMEQEDNEVNIKVFKDGGEGILTKAEIENAFKENNADAINARFSKLMRMKKNKAKNTNKLVARKPHQQKSVAVQTDLMNINSDLANIMKKYKTQKKQHVLNRK